MPLFPLLIASPYVFHDEFHDYIKQHFSLAGIRWRHECAFAEYEYIPQHSTRHDTSHRCTIATYTLADERRACDILNLARLELARNDSHVDVICGDEAMDMHHLDLEVNSIPYTNATHYRRLNLARDTMRRLSAVVTRPETDGCFDDGDIGNRARDIK